MEGGGEATMCHNKLQPSKVAKEWRNIPLLHMNQEKVVKYEKYKKIEK